eukprot:scaffold5_cov331-Pavlova_lutheri.AAC.48
MDGTSTRQLMNTSQGRRIDMQTGPDTSDQDNGRGSRCHVWDAYLLWKVSKPYVPHDAPPPGPPPSTSALRPPFLLNVVPKATILRLPCARRPSTWSVT